MDEELLVNVTLMQSLQERFSSKPSKKSEENGTRKDKGKKKLKELKVLDAKSAQNLSVILGKKVYFMFYFLHCITCSGSTLKNISYTELRKHILNCNTSVLTENLLQSLIQVSAVEQF